jgi:hypothetical protein
MDARRIGLGLAVTGAGAQVAGLAVDAWRHSSGGAGPDGLLSAENAGHVLFVAGLVLVAVGAVLALFGPRLYRAAPEAGPGRRLAQFGAPVVAVLVVTGGLAGAGSSSLTATSSSEQDTAHAHAEEPPAASRCDLDVNTAGYYREAVAAGVDLNGGAGAHDHGAGDEPTDAGPGVGSGEVAGVAPAPATDADADEHEHDGPQQWQPITDPVVCEELRAELATAAEVAARYPTPTEAREAGYVMVTTYLPDIASHWMNFSLVDDRFEVDRPEMLLYDGIGPDATMVGLSYYLVGTDEAPTVGFAGGNTPYHRHVGLCVRGTLVVGGEKLSAEECAARGGVKNDGSQAWMAHAWVVPGCESPWGVFSAKNPKLTVELGAASGVGAPCSGSGTDYDDTPGVPTELAHVVVGAESG